MLAAQGIFILLFFFFFYKVVFHSCLLLCLTVYPFSEVEPQKRNDWFWHDSEGNRDATKTTIASRYMFTSSLENTLSQDYFTEKRYQVHIARRFPFS